MTLRSTCFWLSFICAVFLVGCTTVAQNKNRVMIKYAPIGSDAPRSIYADNRALLRGYVKPDGVPLDLYRDVPEIATLAGYAYRGSAPVRDCAAAAPMTFTAVPDLRVHIPDQWIRPNAGLNNEAVSLPLYAQLALGISAPQTLSAEERMELSSGLTYDVWQRETGPDSRDYAIVFRGTNLRSKGDWCANLRPIGFCDDQNDQFDQVAALIEPLVETLIRRATAEGRRARIITVGHSLGGALAQQAAYRSPHINLAFAFNATPLLGYLDSDILSGDGEGRKGLTIFQIFEAGEILAPVRAMANSLRPLSARDPQIIILRYSLHSGLYPFVGVIRNHNMVELACGLRAVEQDVLNAPMQP
ncbi:lipase family protein [Robiginitomaculum antarcticum]|uniref:lipase family protein n=1 Tax=Robiginitomaculum antarcticum TaxID=437507 RepID=UPI00039DBB41|nr:hypothetical protein [Robiginitomaculum antarcticum]